MDDLAQARPVQGDPDRRAPAAGRRSAGYVAIVAALFFALLGWASYTEMYDLRTESVVVEGRVLEVGHGRRPWLVVEFRAVDGHRLRAEVAEFKGRPIRGDLIRIRYHPDLPGIATDASARPSYLSAWMFVVLAVLFAFVVTPLAFRGSLPAPRFPAAAGHRQNGKAPGIRGL